MEEQPLLHGVFLSEAISITSFVSKRVERKEHVRPPSFKAPPTRDACFLTQPAGKIHRYLTRL
jgi:hypothetical protein